MRLTLFIATLIGVCALGLSSCTWPKETSEQLSEAIEAIDSTLGFNTPVIPDTTASTVLSDSQGVFVSANKLDSIYQELTALRTAIENQATALQTAPAQQDTAASGTDVPPDSSKSSIATGPAGGVVDLIQNYGGRILSSFLILIGFFYLIKGLVWVLDRLAEQSATRRLFFKKLVPIIRIVMWIMAVYVVFVYVFRVTGDNLSAAWTAVGVAIGFASQEILKNIFGGLIIIIDQPFQVGDKINIGGTYGEVVSIGLRSTRIVTPDDNLVSVPNAQVVDSQVANANAGALDCQVVVDLYLPGWINVSEAKAIAYSAAANSKYVYLEKPIVVNVKDEYKETFLTHFVVKAYVLDNRYEFAFASDVTETAKAEFQRQNMLPHLINIRDLGSLDGSATLPGSNAHD